MTFDLGIAGLGLLALVSLVFGGLVGVLLGRATTRWLWLIGAVGWFAGGLIASEVVWGTLTEQEIQPIIDGLAFDESLLGGLIGGLAAVLVTWLVTRSTHSHRPMAS
jgi:hypothetical protein